jgi:hypothetical protein
MVSNGIISAIGVTNFLKISRILPIINSTRTIGITKNNPPIRVVLMKDVIRFIGAIFIVGLIMKLILQLYKIII